MTPRSVYRVVSIAETITWTLLIAALIVRAASGVAIVVTIAGGIHGFVFLAYGATAILVAKNQRWPASSTISAVVSAVVPYATIPVEIWLHRRGRLEGAWRMARTDDPRDGAWHDRLMRALLRRPWLLAMIVVVVLIAVFVVLLLVGPPGGRE